MHTHTKYVICEKSYAPFYTSHQVPNHNCVPVGSTAAFTLPTYPSDTPWSACGADRRWPWSAQRACRAGTCSSPAWAGVAG